MRFYSTTHAFYCGVDLHARSMYTHVLDAQGQTVLERNLPAEPQAFLDAIQPYRTGLVVGCECMFAWYWLADLCEDHAIPFTLGHALYMKAIHGGKAKNDKIDAKKIGNAHLKWAFSEAACLMLRTSAAAKKWLERQTKKRGKRKALGILEAKLGRAVYHVWQKQTPFNPAKFLGQ
jgi:hypothetical protein